MEFVTLDAHECTCWLALANATTRHIHQLSSRPVPQREGCRPRVRRGISPAANNDHASGDRARLSGRSPTRDGSLTSRSRGRSQPLLCAVRGDDTSVLASSRHRRIPHAAREMVEIAKIAPTARHREFWLCDENSSCSTNAARVRRSLIRKKASRAAGRRVGVLQHINETLGSEDLSSPHWDTVG